MKLKIRSGVFETNSSSMHSVALLNRKNCMTASLGEALEEDERMGFHDGNITFHSEADLQFGWGFQIVDTFYGRLAYALASYGKDSLDAVVEAVHSIFSEVHGIELPTDSYSGEKTSGYLDHESYGTLQCHLSENGLILSDFLADRNTIIIIDNDNNCVFEDIVRCGILDRDAVKNIDKISGGDM